jgi:hypothetical protein
MFNSRFQIPIRKRLILLQLRFPRIKIGNWGIEHWSDILRAIPDNGGQLERESFRSYVYGFVALRGDTVGAPLAFGDFRHGEAHFGDRYPHENRLDQPAYRDRDGSQRRRRKSRSLDIRKQSSFVVPQCRFGTSGLRQSTRTDGDRGRCAGEGRHVLWLHAKNQIA